MFPQKGIFDFSLNLSYILYNNTQVFKKKNIWYLPPSPAWTESNQSQID